MTNYYVSDQNIKNWLICWDTALVAHFELRVNFTLLVSEKSSLILLWPEHAHTYLSQLGHVSGKRTLPRLRTWKAEVKIFALRPPLLIRATKQSRSFSLCLEAVFSFLVSQGKERARDLRIVCENLGKSLVSQRTDISSYLTKVF